MDQKVPFSLAIYHLNSKKTILAPWIHHHMSKVGLEFGVKGGLFSELSPLKHPNGYNKLPI